MDSHSIHVERNKLLPNYYNKIKHFVNLTYTIFAFYLSFPILCIICFGICLAILKLCTEKKEIWQRSVFLIIYALCGSAILSFMSHFPSILMAWATDPFYASRIGIFYGLSIGLYFVTFHYIYILVRKILEKDGNLTAGYKCWCIFIVMASLSVNFLIVSTFIVIMVLFVVTVPISNSIESAADGVSSIYNGMVILVAALFAYGISSRYISNPFSISDALKAAMKNFKIDNNKEWKKLTNEERLTEVMKAIFAKHKEEIKENLKSKYLYIITRHANI